MFLHWLALRPPPDMWLRTPVLQQQKSTVRPFTAASSSSAAGRAPRLTVVAQRPVTKKQQVRPRRQGDAADGAGPRFLGGRSNIAVAGM